MGPRLCLATEYIAKQRPTHKPQSIYHSSLSSVHSLFCSSPSSCAAPLHARASCHRQGHNATHTEETRASPCPPNCRTRCRRHQQRRRRRHRPLLPVRGGRRGRALRRHAVPGALPVHTRGHPGPAQEAAPGRHLRGREPHRGRGGRHLRQLLVLPPGQVALGAGPPRRQRLPGAAVHHHGRAPRHHRRPRVPRRQELRWQRLVRGPPVAGRPALDDGPRHDGAVGGHHQPGHLPRRLRVPERRARAALHRAGLPPHHPHGEQLARHGQEAARRQSHAVAVDGDGSSGVAAAIHGVRADGEGVPAVGASGGPAAAAGPGDGHHRGRGGGQGRERGVHDGVGGRGGGADQLEEAVRDLHQGRGVHGERGGREEAREPDVHRRRHRQDRHQGQPQRRRRLHHLPLSHSRCGGQQLLGPRPDDRERGRPVEAPGGGAPRGRRPVGVLPVQLRGVPGHAVRALPPAVLPRLRHLRHHRLRVRQRRRRAAGLQPVRAQAAAQPEQHLHGAGPRGPQPEHRHLRPPLQGGRGVGPRHRRRQFHQDLPGPAVEAVLPHRVHAVGAGLAHRPGGMARVERQLRARHALLWRVHEHGARRRDVRPGQVEGVPCHHQRVRGQHLHRRLLHRRRRLARRHIHPLHHRIVSARRRATRGSRQGMAINEIGGGSNSFISSEPKKAPIRLYVLILLCLWNPARY